MDEITSAKLALHRRKRQLRDLREARGRLGLLFGLHLAHNQGDDSIDLTRRLKTEARSLSRYVWSQRFCEVPGDPSIGDMTLDFTLAAPICAVELDEPYNPTEQDLAHVAAIFDDEERRLLTLLTDEEQELEIRGERVPEPVPTKGRDSDTLKEKLRNLKLGVEDDRPAVRLVLTPGSAAPLVVAPVLEGR